MDFIPSRVQPLSENTLFRVPLAAGRPDADDLTEARAFADAVWEKLTAGTYVTPAQVGGQDPVRPYYTPRDRAGNPINILKVKPKTDPDKCDGCGYLCERLPDGLD